LDKTINILIADAHFLSREGLKSLFLQRPHYRVIAETSHKYELFELLKTLKTDILILDHTRLEKFQFTDLALIQVVNPTVKILLISDIDNESLVRSTIDFGVNSYLTKSCDGEEIFSAIEAILKGEKMFCRKIVDLLLNLPAGNSTNCDPTILSEREIEIVRLIASGYSTKEIADTLYRSFHTIATHRKNIMKKLGLSKTSELLVYAMNANLIKPVSRGFTA